MIEHFERFEIYFNNWCKGKVKTVCLIPSLNIGLDTSYNQAFTIDDEIYPSYIGIVLSIGWLWFDVYMQLNFKTNKPLENE